MKKIILIAGMLLSAFTYAQVGNIGINTATPNNTLEIKSKTADTSGLRFTNLTSASTSASSNGKSLSVDGNGDVVLTNKFMYEYYAETPNSPSPSGTVATGSQSLAAGYLASATGSTSLALGNSSKATAQSATAVGISNNATGVSSTAIGTINTAGSRSTAIGWSNVVTVDASNAFGYQNTINVGQQNHAYGVLNTFSGSSEFSLAFGRLNTINASTAGKFNYVYGFQNKANASAYIFGRDNTSSADNANVVGNNITNGVASSLMIGLSDTAKTTILANGNHGINTTTPNSTLQVSGSFGAAVRTGSGALTSTDYTVVATGNVTLPAASAANANRIYQIYMGTTSDVTISGANIYYLGSVSTSWTLKDALGTSVGNRGITLQSDGTNWLVIGRSN